MSEPLTREEIHLPAGEAREDEREIEKIADRIQNSEPVPGRMREAAVLPMQAQREDGSTSTLVRPDGQPVGIQGQIVTTLSALEARHEELRKVKPCMSCVHSYFPNPKSEAGLEVAAHVSMAKRLSISDKEGTVAEYMHCRAWDKCVHASQHCHFSWGEDRHSFRRGWLAAVKASMGRMLMGRRSTAQ